MTKLIRACYLRYFKRGHIRLHTDSRGWIFVMDIIDGHKQIEPGPNYESAYCVRECYRRYFKRGHIKPVDLQYWSSCAEKDLMELDPRIKPGANY